MNELQGRALHYALVASIALHAALIFGLPALHESLNAPVPPPIQGRLLEQPVVPEAEKPSPQKPVRIAKPAPKAPEPIPEAVTQSPAAPAVETPPAQAVAAAPAAMVPGVAIDARPLGEYRRELLAAAERLKRYPPLARENNWVGSVLLGVAVSVDSSAQFSVKKGSGHKILDQQALDTFNQAARAVAVPAALRGKPFALEVRMIYGLED